MFVFEIQDLFPLTILELLSWLEASAFRLVASFEFRSSSSPSSPPLSKRTVRNLCWFIFAPVWTLKPLRRQADLAHTARFLSVEKKKPAKETRREKKKGKTKESEEGKGDASISLPSRSRSPSPFVPCSFASSRYISSKQQQHRSRSQVLPKTQPAYPNNQPNSLSLPNPPSSRDAVPSPSSPPPRVLPNLLLQACEGRDDLQLASRNRKEDQEVSSESEE